MLNLSKLVYGIYITYEDAELVEIKLGAGETVYDWRDVSDLGRGITHVVTCATDDRYVIYDAKHYYYSSEGEKEVVDPVSMQDMAAASTVNFSDICAELGIPDRKACWLLVS